MRDQKQREAAMQRRVGQSGMMREMVQQQNDKLTDWYARCRKCGKLLQGSKAEVLNGCEMCNEQSGK